MMDLLHFEIERGKYKAVTSTLTQIGLRDNLRMGTMQTALHKRNELGALSLDTIRPVQIARSRLFIPEIIDSAISMG